MKWHARVYVCTHVSDGSLVGRFRACITKCVYIYIYIYLIHFSVRVSDAWASYSRAGNTAPAAETLATLKRE